MLHVCTHHHGVYLCLYKHTLASVCVFLWVVTWCLCQPWSSPLRWVLAPNAEFWLKWFLWRRRLSLCSAAPPLFTWTVFTLPLDTLVILTISLRGNPARSRLVCDERDHVNRALQPDSLFKPGTSRQEPGVVLPVGRQATGYSWS